MMLVHFFKYLGRDNSDTQIALGIATGMLLGFIPAITLHWFIIFAVVLLVRMNLLAVLISFQIFTLVSWILFSPLEKLGFWVLTSQEALLPLFARAYHAPILPFTSFNHGTVMGTTIVSLLLFAPLVLVGRIMVHRLRTPVHTFWLSTRLQRAYAHYRRMTD